MLLTLRSVNPFLVECFVELSSYINQPGLTDLCLLDVALINSVVN